MFSSFRYYACIVVLATAVSSAVADVYDAPPTYYNSATSTVGPTLKAQLNDIIDGHTLRNYSTTAGDNALLKLDEDPNNTSNVLLVYNGVSIAKTLVLNTNYNREHLWPDSYGLDGTNRAYSDLFNLRICDANVNSDRSNDYYDNGGGVAHAEAPGCNQVPGVSWEPRPVEKGDLARSMFYMDTRYENDGNDDFPRNLTLVGDGQLTTINTSNNNMGNLSTLLKWHYQDPVAQTERRRNHLIYTSDTSANGWNGTAYNQGNRNPFIDHPEYVWAVFGDGNNNAKIHVGAATPNGDTTATVIIGRVMKNGTMPTGSITLNKTGVHPTTFDVTLGGEATSTSAGQQSFDYNDQARALPLGLSSSTATTGLKTGTVTIDNTDITTGGAGMGSADGNDVITVTAQVLDNRLITGSPVAFGSVIVGSPVTGGTTLTTTGSDDNFTRITVKGSPVVADANGVSITVGSDVLFNASAVTASRTLSATFTSAGPKSGPRSFVRIGEGLAGEAINSVTTTYTATALDHSNASLSSSSDVNSQTVNFGYVPAGAAARTSAFGVSNLVANASYTAGLAMTNITGDNAALTTNAATFLNLPAGSTNNYLLSLSTGAVGAFSTTHTFTVADQTLPGATSNTSLTLVSSSRVFDPAAALFPATGSMFIPGNEPLTIGTSSISNAVALTKTGPGAITITGAQSNGTGSQLIINGGDLTMNSDAGSAAARTLAITANPTAGVITFGASEHLASLTLDGAIASLTAGGNKVMVVNNISITGSGKLDVTDNDLVVKSMSYSSVEPLVISGFGNFDWLGTGITSSTAAAFAQSDGSRAVGVIDNADWGHGIFGGEPVSGTDILVKYTWTGDANVDGLVDNDDFGQFLYGFSGAGSPRWLNGDFDYSGVVDNDDFGWFLTGLNAFNASGGVQLSDDFKSELAEFASANGLPLVLPEPSVAGAMVILTGLSLARRRRAGRRGTF